ncbi:MAG TPA: hypothetical protein VEF04_09055 [Blastocatellia bacterium]|nr:hypothetical protein [Blastocatellia bacterium]
MTTQLTILQKNGMFSFLGLIQAQQIDVTDEEDFTFEKMIAVVKLDPREGKPFLKQFESSIEAFTNYEKAINTSLERGWQIAYRGAPLQG